MNYAIIAAGEGSRLAQEGVQAPKPLVELNGIPLIDRLIALFCSNGAESISIIVNEEMIEVRRHVESIRLSIPLNIVVKSTPSSMHSFYELSRFLKKGKFCLTTVDTIFKQQDFGPYIQRFIESDDCDGIMAVTDYIDDEKPLYVGVDNEMNITGFLDTATGNEKYISGGIYCLTPKAIEILEECMENGITRMRNYQRQLIAGGLKLEAYPFRKIVDVDHAGDIEKAEAFLNEDNTTK